jgi:hypothetical protein
MIKRRLVIFGILIWFWFLNPSFVWASDAWAVLQQTAKQTAEHIQRLKELTNTVQLLQKQVQDTQEILELATEASSGKDGVDFITDFRNVVVETKEIFRDLKKIEGFVDIGGDVAGQWKDVFGSLDAWLQDAGVIYENLDMSDSVNSRSYTIADSYQKNYQQNARYAQQLAENSKVVNEKGAMRQIAQELAHLIEMENQTMFLLSELLRTQSVGQANDNLDRKEKAVQLEQENKEIRQIIGIVDPKVFKM